MKQYIKEDKVIYATEKMYKLIYEAQGYTPRQEKVTTQNDANKLTVEQIRNMLDEKGVEYDPKAKRPELVELLEGAE